MILAAGRGERMRPLTDKLPKPLLQVHNKPLIEYHLEKFQLMGIKHIVINHAWLGHLIPQRLGLGMRWNMDIIYSDEGDNALETAGGIKRAFTKVDSDWLIVTNGDIWTDFDFSLLPHSLPENKLAHIILVDNPSHNKKGDFAFNGKELTNQGEVKYTFSGIALYHRRFFSKIEDGARALGPLIREHIERGQVTGELYQGDWFDIGTPQRLQDLECKLNDA